MRTRLTAAAALMLGLLALTQPAWAHHLRQGRHHRPAPGRARAAAFVAPASTPDASPQTLAPAPQAQQPQPKEQGYLKAPPNTPKRATGASMSPRHLLLSAEAHAPSAPAPAQYLRLPQRLSYWLNEKDGDCVTAEEAFARACTGVFISDAEVERWARRYDALEGAVISEVLDWMSKDGFRQDGNEYRAGHKLSVRFTDAAAMRSAVFAGPVKLGVAAGQLHDVVGTKNGWFAVGLRVDTDYDHCVSVCGYGSASYLAGALGVTVPSGVDPQAECYAVFTWNGIGVVERQSLLNISCEAWVRQPTTVTLGTSPPTPDVVVVPPPPVTPVTPPPPAPQQSFAVTISRTIQAGGVVSFRVPRPVAAGRWTFAPAR